MDQRENGDHNGCGKLGADMCWYSGIIYTVDPKQSYAGDRLFKVGMVGRSRGSQEIQQKELAIYGTDKCLRKVKALGIGILWHATWGNHCLREVPGLVVPPTNDE